MSQTGIVINLRGVARSHPPNSKRQQAEWMGTECDLTNLQGNELALVEAQHDVVLVLGCTHMADTQHERRSAPIGQEGAGEEEGVGRVGTGRGRKRKGRSDQGQVTEIHETEVRCRTALEGDCPVPHGAQQTRHERPQRLHLGCNQRQRVQAETGEDAQPNRNKAVTEQTDKRTDCKAHRPTSAHATSSRLRNGHKGSGEESKEQRDS